VAVPACLRLADEIFPRVRAACARRLVADEGWSQARAAQFLGISQAMVSKHVASRPPRPDAIVDRLADDLIAEALTPQAAAGASSWCATLSIEEERPGGRAALQDLLAAERTLRSRGPLKLMPQIGLNIARAIPGAEAAHDVLAFPGRLVAAGDRMVAPAPPAFGGSQHLARCLLTLRKRDPSLLAIANVRGGPDAVRALRAIGSRPATLAGAGAPDARFERAARQGARPATLLHDPGAVGIEPCLYIAASDAQGVAARILELENVLVKP
jgi:predicted fused transcriptional regulator/phosphomethylpyrimidine kinase